MTTKTGIFPVIRILKRQEMIMNTLPLKTSRPLRHLLFAFAGLMIAISAIGIRAQAPPLSLADILIALRSKKVTLAERNQILTGAVKERGITFEFTPEIEKELAATGADADLIAAIRMKSLPPPKPTPEPKPAATPQPTPPPPDYTFYQKRAEANLSKGDLEAALADYNKAVEMKADNPDLYVSRGRAYFNMKSYELSVKDFDKAIELNPKTAIAFIDRGRSYEKLGDRQKALADYKKALELDAANDVAKAEVSRIEAEIAKEAAKNAPPPKPVEVVRPEFINLGSLSASNAVKLVSPVYNTIARQARVEGVVTVEVEINTDGDVVSANAVSGPTMLRQAAEDAARRSKFKPAMFNGEPIKAKGVISYSFKL
ncbi:MAG: TonB family protein [Pyrinomonadaceae bacterium]